MEEPHDRGKYEDHQGGYQNCSDVELRGARIPLWMSHKTLLYEEPFPFPAKSEAEDRPDRHTRYKQPLLRRLFSLLQHSGAG